MMLNMEICIVNPNSSKVTTNALEKALTPLCPPDVNLTFVTGPSTSPPSINDAPTMVISASETYKHLTWLSPHSTLEHHGAKGYIIACFSDHPLATMLRHSVPCKPSVHLLEAAVLRSGTRFGVLTTGKHLVSDIDAGVRRIMGANSDRYVGTVPTGLGVLQLQEGNETFVHDTIKKGAAEVATRGADVIILGCAGMAGMESLVRQGVKEAGLQDNVAVVDGAKAGVQIITGLIRSQYRE